MKKLAILLLSNLILIHVVSAQETNDTSSHLLEAVIIKAYEGNHKLKEIPTGINYITSTQLNKYNNSSILPAVNATPGARMEERSPASYRLNIRGSSLRSPFGVRNVKIYWNSIPFTDPGGTTYLNQLSYFDFYSVEIIKGPGGSLYGAGTGGVILINGQPEKWSRGADVNYIAGNYNSNNLNVQVRTGQEDNRDMFSYTHQTSDGYRNHTNMRRDIATWQTSNKLNERQRLNASVMYGDLYYQTPGALTKAQYDADPKASRPAAGTFPSADGAKAAIYQKTFLAGITHEYQFTEHLLNISTVYGAFSQIKNPTFRNYERRTEPHFGGRSLFKWGHHFSNIDLQLLFGGEAQKGFFNTKTFANANGQPGAVITDDEINNWVYSFFMQGDIRLPHDLNITAGASINKSSMIITRLTGPATLPVKRTFTNELAPRIAVSKKIISNLWLYGSFSKGFSPPSSQDVLPSTSVINTDLEAEHGNNYEAGVKSSWLKQKLYVEVNAFSNQLRNAIVARKDATNADYFVNAGSAKQNGLESQASYQLMPRRNGFISSGRIWVNHTWNNFRYKEFKPADTLNYGSNQLPGVAKHTVAAGMDLSTRPGFYINMTYFYSDKIALNDANSVFATSYNLFGSRLGWQTQHKGRSNVEFFVGADNLFDVKYSLGNDINATAGRYFNAAAGRNFFGGVSFHFIKKQS
jgi:iron complex outermembrane receptor protein